jgi:hypothetical protein
MSLNLEKLEKVRKLAGGVVQARCPACAEGGNDRSGEHLRVFPDGKFGCCVHPKDGDHRKRIFALAGVRDRQDIRVTVAGPKVAKIIQSDVLGRLGRVFSGVAELSSPNTTTGGTFGTTQYPLMCEKKNIIHTCKGFQSGVLSVPEQQVALQFERPVPSVPTQQVAEQSESPVPSVPTAKLPEPLSHAGERLPYLTGDGTLVIPFDSPERYHWWKLDGNRQTVAQTLKEVRAGLATKERTNYADDF